jgi:ABC-type multidrug transport system fused ATPase/permease subunit
VTHNLRKFLKGKTVILVAHRLQTVQNADLIIVLEGGQMTQCGTFNTLVSAEGRFKQLWEKQVQMNSPNL